MLRSTVIAAPFHSSALSEHSRNLAEPRNGHSVVGLEQGVGRFLRFNRFNAHANERTLLDPASSGLCRVRNSNYCVIMMHQPRNNDRWFALRGGVRFSDIRGKA